MTILGIDPGTATTGYGLISVSQGRYTAIDYGCILTDKQDTAAQRLAQLYDSMRALLANAKPDVVAVEKLFFNTNVTTAMTVGQARGVVMLAVEQRHIELAEYTPLQVKMAVCGYGRAKKPQIKQMMMTLLRLTQIPKPDDAADALAIAMCHGSGRAVKLKPSELEVRDGGS
jgi:crossover junction endodeoxyribonuclease RuvC